MKRAHGLAVLLLLSTCASPQVFAACVFGGSSEPSLQSVFDSILPAGTLSATDDCLDAAADARWTAPGEAVATIIIELAGFAGSNEFGIYDVSDPLNRVTVFGGADGVGSTTTIELRADGSEYSVWADAVHAGDFATNTFGFYLATPQGYVFTSDPSHNSDGQDHLYSYQGNGATFLGGPLAGQTFAATMYLLAFEDLLIPQGDEDFQDFVAAASFVVPIPLPPAALLLGSAIALLVVVRKRRRVTA